MGELIRPPCPPPKAGRQWVFNSAIFTWELYETLPVAVVSDSIVQDKPVRAYVEELYGARFPDE